MARGNNRVGGETEGCTVEATGGQDANEATIHVSMERREADRDGESQYRWVAEDEQSSHGDGR